MATRCYTDEQIAQLIAASAGNSDVLPVQTFALTDEEFYRQELDAGRADPTRVVDTTPPPAPPSTLVLSPAFNNLIPRTNISTGVLQRAPTAQATNGYFSDLLAKYPFLDPYYREKYGTPSGSLPPVLGGPVQNDGPVLVSQPTETPTRADIPAPTNQQTQNGDSSMNGFSCPSPSVGTCFSDIPRADVSEVLTFAFEDGATNVNQVVDLDNVRGMNLCTLSGIITWAQAGTPPTPDMYQALFFYGTYTLHFRGQTVPGWTDRPLSEILADPGCCDAEVAHINCLIPEYGSLEIEIDLGELTFPGDSFPVISTRLRFSGCECVTSACGCGCGGHPRRQFSSNPPPVIDG